MILFNNRKIRLCKEKIDAIEKDAKNNNRFSLFMAKFSKDLLKGVNDYDLFSDYYNCILGHDEDCKLFYKEGLMLDNLSETNQVFIHRTNLYLDESVEGVPINDDLYSIMHDGLKNYGHMNAAGGSAFSKEPQSLCLTMSHFKGLAGYINLLSQYKYNDTIIISSFPKDIIDNDGCAINDYSDIYDLSGSVPSVKPEFMLGALLKKDDGFWHYYSKEEIINKHEKKKNF